MKRNRLHFTLGAAFWLLLSIPLAQAVTYEEWQAVAFTAEEIANASISGPDADPDGDGRNNFLEFTLSSAAKTAGGGDDISLWLGSDNHLRLRYPRLKSRVGLLYAPMVTNDLNGLWYAGPDVLEESGVSERDAATDAVTVRDLFGTEVTSHRFIRLFVAVDWDNDGLPDDWERVLFGNLDEAAADDYDLDGLTNLFEWQQGGGPHAADYYNGQLPTLAILSGNAQQAGPNVFLPQPLTVEVRNSANALLINAPIHFEIIAGAGRIAKMVSDTPGSTLDLRTDAQGQVAVWFKTPFIADTSTVRASAHSGAQITAVNFTETTVTLPGAPQYFTAGIDDDQNHELKWVPGSGNATGFTLWQSLDDGATWQAVAQVTAPTESANVPATQGENPLWAATADNDAGSSPKTYEPAFALRDDDSDGFDNQTESDLGTERLNSDSDGDGTLDGADIDPLDADLDQPRVPETRYAMLNLAAHGLTTASTITDINNAMQIIGDANDGAWLWENGERTIIPLFWPSEINDSGVVVGQGVYSPNHPTFAATCEKGDTSPTILRGYMPQLIGNESILLSPIPSASEAINNAGVVAGNSWGYLSDSLRNPDYPDGTIVSYAALTTWSGSNPMALGGVIFDVPGSAGVPMIGRAINDDGVVAGHRWTAAGKWQAAVYDSVQTMLPTAFNNYSEASAINKDSILVGYESNPDGSSKAALWQKRNGTWTNKILEPTAGANTSLASGIMRLNDRLEILADFYDTDTGKFSHLWQNGRLTNLEGRLPEGWTLFAASAINDAGVIVGSAQYTAPQPSAAPSTPVPAAVLPLDLQVRARMGKTNPNPLDWEPSKTPKSLIVDVNNGLVNGQRRNADFTLLGEEKNNGSYNDLQRVEPIFLFIPGKQVMKDYKVILKLVGAPEKVRIFDSDITPVARVGSVDGGVEDTYELSPAQVQRGNQTFWIEGIEAGEFTVSLEAWDASYANLEPYLKSPPVRFEVNVDREPIAAGDVAKFPSRHRVRAVKTAGQLRGMKGNIYGKRPLATWTPQRLRSGLTESLWFGLDSTTWQGFPLPTWLPPGKQRPAGPKAWVQTGLQVSCDQSVDYNSQSQSYAYAEVVADFDLATWALQARKERGRYFSRRTYPSTSTVRHRWQNAAFSAEYQPNLSNSLQDRFIVQLTAIPGGSAVTLIDFAGDRGEGGDPDVDLSLINFDSYQAGAEMTSSVSRLPGTKDQPASIDYMSVKTGPRTSISSWQQTNFQDNNLEICLVNANGVEERFTGNDPTAGTGAVAKLHYNIGLGNAYSLSLWDKYNWLEQDPQRWTTP